MHVSDRLYLIILLFEVRDMSTYRSMYCCTRLAVYLAALNAGRSNREKGVCPSVCLSAKRMDCDKTDSVQIFYTIRKII